MTILQTFNAPFNKSLLDEIDTLAQGMPEKNPNTLLFLQFSKGTPTIADIYWIADHYLNHPTPDDMPKMEDITKITIASFNTDINELFESNFENTLLDFLMDFASTDGGDDSLAHIPSELLRKIFNLLISDETQYQYLLDRDLGKSTEEIFTNIYFAFRKILINL